MNISHRFLHSTLVAIFLSSPLAVRPAHGVWAGEQSLRHQFAQAPSGPAGKPVRIRGKISGLEGNQLRVAVASGEVRIKLTEPLRINGVAAAKLSDITAGTFIGTAGHRQADGSFRAVEVHIFPEAMRGAGEGQNPHDLPGTTMTNANVVNIEKAVEKVEGQVLTLKHKGGEVKVVVTPNTPVVRIFVGDRDLLTPGAGVYIIATQATDGSISARAVNVGVGGIVPPM